MIRLQMTELTSSNKLRKHINLTEIDQSYVNLYNKTTQIKANLGPSTTDTTFFQGCIFFKYQE